MRIVVIGTGVMGLATARVLAERGHDVVAIDRFGIGNVWSSSPGSTRIWRLAHTERFNVRLAHRTVDAWRDLERRTGRTLLLQVGLLWRGADAVTVHESLTAEGVDAELVGATRQHELFPELVTDDRPVLWQPEAGALLAAEGLAAQHDLFEAAGGRLVVGETVTDVERRPSGGVTVVTDASRWDADVAVITAGPWAKQLLQRVGIDLRLAPALEQLAYVAGPPGWEQRPAFVDEMRPAGGGGDGGFYAMPTPGVGYKLGIEREVRPWQSDVLDRTPDPDLQEQASEIFRRCFPGFGPEVLRSEVCTWTEGPDDHFVLDRVGDVVLGTSDNGTAFKFSPLIGEILADLTEGRPLDDDAARFSLARFA